MVERPFRKHAGAVSEVQYRGIQHEPAQGVGELAAFDSEALVDRQCRAPVIGRQEDVERRTLGDLGIEHAGGAETEHDVMARCGFKIGSQALGNFGEVCGDRRVDRFAPAGRHRHQCSQ